MAKTVDEIALKISVDGAAQLDQANTKLGNIEQSARKTADSLKTFNTRTLTANIQDIAVQAEMGVNWMRILGQQGSEVLAAFGPQGAAAGAALAVGIAVARPVLSAMGIDMRNLQERTKDLTDSVKAYQASQQANLPTLQGLGNTYGDLTSAAKDFFMAQQQLTDRKTFLDLKATISEVKKEFGFLSDEAYKAAQATEIAMGKQLDTSIMGAPLKGLIQAKLMGLSIDQARELGNRLQELDNNAPEKNLKVITDTSLWLKETIKDAETERKVFEGVIEPLSKVNNQILESKKNLKESAQQASELNSALLDIQNSFQPDINASRRNFDQVTATRKEGAMKIAEFTKQLEEKSSKDQVDRSKELAAFQLRTNQDVADKVADFAKSQSEAYRTSMLTNDVKMRQLEVESKIADLQKYSGYTAEYNLKFEEDSLRFTKEYQDTLQNIAELRRKNTINATQEGDLRKQALNIQNQELDNAKQLMGIKVQQFIDKQAMDNAVKSYDEMISRQTTMADGLRKINEQKIDLGFQTGLRGLTDYQKQVETIKEEGRKAGLALQQAFAAKFADGGDGLTPEKMAELQKNLDDITKTQKTLTDARLADAAVAQTWGTGWADAFAKYKGDAENSAMQAKSYFDTFTSGFEDAMVSFVKTGKLSFTDLANSLIAQFVKIQTQKALTGLFDMGGGSSGFSFGSLFGGIGKLFGFAGGGTPPVDRPSIIGENGPEMWIPRTAGTIVPNGGFGGSTSVTYNINAVDSSSFKAMIARDPEFIHNVVEQGRRSLPTRSRR